MKTESFQNLYESLGLTEGGTLDEAEKISPENKKKLRKLLTKVKNGQKLNDLEKDALASFLVYLNEAKVKIVASGKGEMKKYQLMVPDGSELIDMEFTSPNEAKKYAKKKGFQITEQISREDFFKQMAKQMGRSITHQSLMARPNDPQTMHIDKHFNAGKTPRQCFATMPVINEEEPAGKTVARALLKKFQFKDAFQIDDDNVAKWLTKKKLVSVNKGKGTYSITDKGKNFVESINENGKEADLKDDKLKKLYNQMKDERLSGAAAMQFKAIVREMKKRKISLTENSGGVKLYSFNEMVESLGLGLEEGSTENAAKSLSAILGMFKGKHDNDIYKMGKGIQDYYKKEGSFAPDQAKWIWKTSVALFKK
jgi:hypothetical protein